MLKGRKLPYKVDSPGVNIRSFLTKESAITAYWKLPDLTRRQTTTYERGFTKRSKLYFSPGILPPMKMRRRRR